MNAPLLEARDLNVWFKADDGSRVVFLRSGSGTDRVNALWVYDVEAGVERPVVDPSDLLGADDDDVPPEERARRERLACVAPVGIAWRGSSAGS